MPSIDPPRHDPEAELRRFLSAISDSADAPLSPPCIALARDLLKKSSSASPPSAAPCGKEAQLGIAGRLGKIAYWEYDVTDDHFTFNDQFYAIYRTTAEEQGGYRMTPEEYERRFVHPDERPLVREQVKRAIEAPDPGYTSRLEHKFIYGDGEVGHLAVEICLRQDETRKTIKTFGANQDISDLKRTERQLKRINRLMNSIRSVNRLIYQEKDIRQLASKTANSLIVDRDFIDAWIAVFDPQQNAFEVIAPTLDFGHHRAEGPLDWLDSLVEASRRDFEKAARRQHRFDYRRVNERLSTVCLPIRFEERFFGFLSVTATAKQIDLQVQQELSSELANDLAFAFLHFEVEKDAATTNQALRIAKESAERANRAKDEFLAIISHEIRTPLNPILGYTHLLEDRLRSPQDRTYLEAIRRAAQQQLSLVDHILSYCRLDQGNVKPHKTEFPLLQVCEAAIADAQSEPKDLKFMLRNGAMHAAIPPDLVVETDEGMLAEILSNLLSNACKYTPSGTVSLELGYREREGKTGEFHFVVADTGIGIDALSLVRLFEPFAQADTSYTRKHKGVGLGLAICKKLVDTLGGQIGAESEVGHGSRFWFRLPLDIIFQRQTEALPDPVDLQNELQLINGQNVLLVEDNAENSAFTRCLLEAYGALITVAENGQDALHLCSRKKFALILMDLAMPGMSGLETTKRIRNSLTLNALTPIIPLTADASAEAQRKCSTAGMNGFLTKPIAMVRLADTVKAVLN